MLYIHIGTCKTGTTSIQKTIKNNRELLDGMGFCDVSKSVKRIIFHENQQQHILQNEKSNLKKCLSKFQNIIVSNESFAGDPMLKTETWIEWNRELKSLISGYEYKIIIYLRPQADLIESLYTQFIHEGGSFDFEEYYNEINMEWLNYEKLVAHVSSIWGKEAIIVRRYQREALVNGDSISDFFTLLNIDLSKINTSDYIGRRGNAGYNRRALEFAKICNPHLTQENKILLRNLLQNASTKGKFEDFGYLSREQLRKIHDDFEESNALLARQYLSEGPLFHYEEGTAEQVEQEYEFDLNELSILTANMFVTLSKSLSGNLGLGVKERQTCFICKLFAKLRSFSS